MANPPRYYPVRQNVSMPFNSLLPPPPPQDPSSHKSPNPYRRPTSPATIALIDGERMQRWYDRNKHKAQSQFVHTRSPLLHKAWSVKASYLEVHEWYAEKMGTRDDSKIKGAFISDLGMLVADKGMSEEKRVWYAELRRQRRQYQRKNTQAAKRAIKAARNEVEKKELEEMKLKHRKVLNAQHATSYELKSSAESLDALEESESWKGDPYKERFMEEFREDVDELERRFYRLDDMRMRILARKKRERNGMKMRGWAEGWLPEHGLKKKDMSNEDGEEYSIAEFEEEWLKILPDIEKSIKGIGGLALGYVDSESESEDGW